MPLLIDTCTLWWITNKKEQGQLSSHAVSLLNEFSDDLFCSAISAFELGMKFAKGKLRPHSGLNAEEWFRRALQKHGIVQVPINFQIAAQATLLPSIHRDPCDRMIIATAQEYNMKILTPDKLISQYPQAKCVW